MALTHFTFDRFLSDELIQEQDALDKRFEKLDRDKSANAESVAKVKNTAPENFNQAEANRVAQINLELLRREKELRDSLGLFLEKVEGERVGKVSQRVGEELHTTRADIREKLLTMGYLEAPAGERSSLTADMIEKHPRVVVARNDLVDCQSDLTSHRVHNEKALAEVCAALDKFKEKALAAI